MTCCNQPTGVHGDAVAGRRRRADWRRRCARRRGAAGDDERCGCSRKSGICDAPLYVAGELLRADGFTDVRFVHIEAGNSDAGMVADGKLDFSQSYAAESLRQIDAGKPLTVLAGVHPGCHELFAREPINSIMDLRGKRVAIPEETGYANRLILFIMASSVGFDPAKEINWVTAPAVDPIEAFVDGEADAFFGGPVEAQMLRRADRLSTRRAEDRDRPALVAILLLRDRGQCRLRSRVPDRDQAGGARRSSKAADICLAEPKRAARSPGRGRLHGPL